MVARKTASAGSPQGLGAVGTVSVSDHDGIGTWLVGLDGEHDLSTVRMLEAGTAKVLDGCTRVVVDLSSATFFDCSVINWLMRTKHALEAGGGQPLLVVDGTRGGTTARVIDAAGVRDSFAFYPTRRAAFSEPPSRPVTGDDRWARARRKPTARVAG